LVLRGLRPSHDWYFKRSGQLVAGGGERGRRGLEIRVAVLRDTGLAPYVTRE
jgi:hypothetical protein